jgi:hypothetical protein
LEQSEKIRGLTLFGVIAINGEEDQPGEQQAGEHDGAVLHHREHSCAVLFGGPVGFQVAGHLPTAILALLFQRYFAAGAATG